MLPRAESVEALGQAVPFRTLGCLTHTAKVVKDKGYQNTKKSVWPPPLPALAGRVQPEAIMSLTLITFGKRTFKDLGETGEEQCCVWCSRPVFYHLILVRTWLTYFFIPVIPYRSEYLVQCPVCSGGMEIRGDEIEAAKRGELRLHLIEAPAAGGPNRN